MRDFSIASANVADLEKARNQRSANCFVRQQNGRLSESGLQRDWSLSHACNEMKNGRLRSVRQSIIQGPRGANEGDMRESLREISQVLAARAKLLGV